ncbi:GH25 family lysozyme [Eubacterium coprostanoligenes]|uniref:GH25 family lysozyme n=1 Tax=Eubacterium coprostanoligenes TaxID=290054 RepID=UPI0023561720|nr:GH25 family lysozyme [Eubacterium coprostanoligenes]MCI6253595.1 fibronectin type III domain-containing protein [Eubacterium coprostanoligenes]MDY5399345.1 GH25 family lysozyme [Eubacterium coprostanoligenes]
MKKSIKKIMSLLLAGTMLVTPITASAFTGGSIFMEETLKKGKYVYKTYTHQDRFANMKIQHGIDVSYHNGNLDWSAIKSAGVDFAILRAAYRGYGDEGTLVKDSKFAEYIRGAQSYGIPVGAYIYSQAITTAEAVQEANYILNIVKNYSLDLPIVFDYEFSPSSEGRTNLAWAEGELNKTKMTNITLAFCNTIKSAGYDVMVYASKSFLNKNIDHEVIEDAGYDVWLAHYVNQPYINKEHPEKSKEFNYQGTDYTGDFKIWQYTSTGRIPGIEGKRFDCNFMYGGDISSSVRISDIPNQVYTGSEVVPSFTVTYGDNILVDGLDYVATYQNNSSIGTATVNVLGAGTYEGLLNLTKKFNIVPATVQNIEFSNVKTTSAEISWQAVDGASGYIIQIQKNGKWTNLGTYPSERASIKGLMPGSVNNIHIAAYTNVNGINYMGAYSDAVKIETAVGAVNPRVSAYANNFVTLTWDKQTAANGYEVFKYDASSKKYVLYKNITNPNTNTCKVTGLASNKKYNFKVRAYQIDDSEKTYAPFGAVVSQYTSIAKPKLNSAKSTSKKKIKASWSKVKGASGYQVMWSTYKNFSKNYKTKSVKAKYSSKTVTTAQSKKTYYVRVRAYKTISGKKVYSPWSNTKKVKTK